MVFACSGTLLPLGTLSQTMIDSSSVNSGNEEFYRSDWDRQKGGY